MGRPRRPGLGGGPAVVLAGAMACGISDTLQAAAESRQVRVIEVPDYDAATIAGALRDAVAIVTPVLQQTMVSCAPMLRLVQCPGTGLDRIELSSLPSGVSVAKCFGHAQAIAEYVVGAALVLTRDVLAADRALRRGDWSYAGFSSRPAAADLHGCTAVILGSGHAASEVVRLLASHGVATVVVSRDPVAAQRRLGSGPEFREIRDLDEILPRADLLIVTLPLTPATGMLLNDDRLGLLGRHAIVINVSRGGIVDEAALYGRLDRGDIRAAAVDVWQRTPLDWRSPNAASNVPFERLDNVLMTPHLAGWSRATRAARHACMLDNVLRLLDGRALKNVAVVT